MSDESPLVHLTVGQLRALVRDELKLAMKDRAPAEKPPVLTSEQAAAYLQIPLGVLRKRAAKGEVPSFKIGAVLRFRRHELDEWIDAGGKAKVG